MENPAKSGLGGGLGGMGFGGGGGGGGGGTKILEELKILYLLLPYFKNSEKGDAFF